MAEAPRPGSGGSNGTMHFALASTDDTHAGRCQEQVQRTMLGPDFAV